MAGGEYGPVVLSGKLLQSEKLITPNLLDAQREQKVSLPSSPQVGEVIGLAVIGDDRGCLLRFEMQASKGSGRIINLGSMHKVMKESVAAAAQFIKTHARDVGLPNDWQNNYDIAVLATMMGIPKEGPSAGITIVTGIVSALTGRPVRHDIAMTGEITIMGKVLAIGGVLPKIQAAINAGCSEVIMPKENERDLQMTPEYVKSKIEVRFVSSIEEVLAVALLDLTATGSTPARTH
jgi:ATP-dependent Lon protease